MSHHNILCLLLATGACARTYFVTGIPFRGLRLPAFVQQSSATPRPCMTCAPLARASRILRGGSEVRFAQLGGRNMLNTTLSGCRTSTFASYRVSLFRCVFACALLRSMRSVSVLLQSSESSPAFSRLDVERVLQLCCRLQAPIEIGEVLFWCQGIAQCCVCCV